VSRAPRSIRAFTLVFADNDAVVRCRPGTVADTDVRRRCL
jgi:hypothetical protein